MIADVFTSDIQRYKPGEYDCSVEQFKDRLSICSECEHRKDIYCLRSSCVGKCLTMKIRKKTKRCPIGAW